MKKYIVLQMKRTARYVPVTCCMISLLLCLLMTGVAALIGQEEADRQKIRVAVTGSTQDVYVRTVIAAIGTMDTAEQTLHLVYMTEEDAKRALKQDDIAAYVVIPDGFAQAIDHGDMMPLTFVSKVGSAGLTAVFKTEITDVIADIFADTQRAVYGLYDGMTANGIEEKRIEHINTLNIQCMEYVFVRDGVYRVDVLGVADSVGLAPYLLCGFAVLFSFLACLSFAPLMIQRHATLHRMLAAKGRPLVWQALTDFGVYAVGVTVTVGAAVCLGFVMLSSVMPTVMSAVSFGVWLWRWLPIMLLIAAFSYMLYMISSDVIGGVLLQFFTVSAMCFVSGCMYPVYFFPMAVQELAAWLPTGVARTQLAAVFTGQTDGITMVLSVGYIVLFVGIGVWARICREKRGCA